MIFCILNQFRAQIWEQPANQGCIRPRPSPFERPSTRYKWVSIPLRGGCRLQDFGPSGAWYQGFQIFGHEATETAPKAPFQKTLKILPNQCTKKHYNYSLRPFQPDTFLCTNVKKFLNFHPDVQNQHFSVRTLIFVLKVHNWTNNAKNAIKHENKG